MVKTTIKHICDNCKCEHTEGEPSDTMFPLAKWIKVSQHRDTRTGFMFPEQSPIFCGWKCVAEFSQKKAFTEIN